MKLETGGLAMSNAAFVDALVIENCEISSNVVGQGRAGGGLYINGVVNTVKMNCITAVGNISPWNHGGGWGGTRLRLTESGFALLDPPSPLTLTITNSNFKLNQVRLAERSTTNSSYRQVTLVE